MEEQILKIIRDQFSSDPMTDEIKKAKEITSMVMEFMDWLMDEADIGNSVWDIGDGEDYSSGEIFEYWLNNIKK